MWQSVAYLSAFCVTECFLSGKMFPLWQSVPYLRIWQDVSYLTNVLKFWLLMHVLEILRSRVDRNGQIWLADSLCKPTLWRSCTNSRKSLARKGLNTTQRWTAWSFSHLLWVSVFLVSANQQVCQGAEKNHPQLGDFLSSWPWPEEGHTTGDEPWLHRHNCDQREYEDSQYPLQLPS